MGHQVIKCTLCGNLVMEGSNDWECDNCGAICNLYTKYQWLNKHAYKKLRKQDEGHK